ncbi:MAG: RNA methyltransferase [Nitrosomonas sp.]|nr:RNA methyltransferase [Nitrosomonas sp.]
MRCISSREHLLFKKILKLQTSSAYRQTEKLALLDGVHLVESYLACGGTPHSLIISESGSQVKEIIQIINKTKSISVFNSLSCQMFSDGLFKHVSSVKTPVGILALISVSSCPSVNKIQGCSFGVMLETIQDPGNLGSILRSAAAAGVSDVFLSTDCADCWSPKTLRAGMGAHFHLRLHEDTDLIQLVEDYDGEIVATTLHDAVSVYDANLREPIIFAFGNEGNGLSEELLKRISKRVKVVMPGKTESLNVAAAAAICLFERVRQMQLHT